MRDFLRFLRFFVEGLPISGTGLAVPNGPNPSHARREETKGDYRVPNAF